MLIGLPTSRRKSLSQVPTKKSFAHSGAASAANSSSTKVRLMAFLGLGAPKGYADWGQMVALARNYIVGPLDDPLKYWYTIAIPGVCIILFVLAWNLIGDALRDAFDPKIRRG